MAKFANTKTATIKPPRGIVRTKSTPSKPDSATYNGADGWERKPKSELFLLAVTNMVGEDTFYEKGAARDNRFTDLISAITLKDPDWIARFVPYLRDTLHMRTASIVMAATYVKAGGPNGRQVIASALSRAEEPSELIAYWFAQYGKKLPQPVKRGIADATLRLYTEKSFIKYDSDSLTPRFGDVIELTHPKALTPWQHNLFRFAIDKRHGREDLTRNLEGLGAITRHRELMALPVEERRPLVDAAVKSGDFSRFDGAGLTWEALSGWLQGPMDAAAWTAIIPQMGYMALLRNLRNFEDAKVPDEVLDKVAAKLTDPEQVAASKQMPLRFISAYKNVTSARWVPVLEKALDLSLANVPALKGRTLVLVDISSSMNSPFSNGPARTFKSGLAKNPMLWEAAALFGSALAVRAEAADLYAYSDHETVIDFRKGASILRTVDAFRTPSHGGTNTWGSLTKTFNEGKHSRVVILTDEQANPGYIPKIDVPLYVINLAGYKTASTSSEERVYSFGGLTDRAFDAINLIEAGKDGVWPF